MEVEIGRHPVEGARPVEHARSEPEGVGARADDRIVALKPLAIEKSEVSDHVGIGVSHWAGGQRRSVTAGSGWSANVARKDSPLRHDRRAATDADCFLAHAATAARMRAQDRAPFWNELNSYFSFGEWIWSSS